MRSRELGDALRRAMERAGLNGKRTAALLGWSESKVSRLLTGRLRLGEADIAAFLTVVGVPERDRERLLRLVREPDAPTWLGQQATGMPDQLVRLVDHENTATRITDFQPIVVNGLLQTGDYARALLERSGPVPPRAVQDRIAARLGRRNIFSRPHRPRFTFFLHEFVLRFAVGSAEIMSDQLHELLRMGVRPYVAIRVIPADFGAHAGTAGSCTLMEFAEFKPVVYLEDATAGRFLDQPDDIAAYRAIFAALADCALDERRSRELISTLAVELYG